MEEIEITPASVDDACSILDLQKTAYRSEAEIYQDWTIPPLHQTLDEIRGELTTHVILKAVCHHRIVGSVRACMRGTTCHIGKLIVDPEFQNQGLGTRLLMEIERVHQEAARFELFTGVKSLKNRHLYQELGYREFMRESPNGRVELVFMEKLSACAGPMDTIEYLHGGIEFLDLVGPMWEELNRHHALVSAHFAVRFLDMTFSKRKAELLEKARRGQLRVDLARDLASDTYMGYCVSTISTEGTGEIDSLFVSERFRDKGIGTALVKEAIAWMDNSGVTTKVVIVAGGNEQAFAFYERFVFFVRNIRLEQKTTKIET